LIHKGKIEFTFKHNDSIEYRCFEYLFNHINKKVTYEEIYKYAFRLKYPAKGKRTKVNRSINNAVKSVVKKMNKQGMTQIILISNMGFTLYIK